MIIQGSNNPLVIQFDANISNIPKMVVSLWHDAPGYTKNPLKVWTENEMEIRNNIAICNITEDDTRSFPTTNLWMAVKGWDADGTTIMWDEIMVDVKKRHDKNITLTRIGGGESA